MLMLNRLMRRFAHLCILLLAVAVPASAGDGVEIMAEGVAAIQDGDMVKARDIALADALRNAVEQAVGTIVDAHTRVGNFAVLEDSIYTRATGYVSSYRIEDTWLADGSLHMRVRATVKQGEIENDLLALRLIIEGAGNPRVMVMIPERHISRPVPDPAAETEIIGRLLDAGFHLVDQTVARQARDTEIARRALAGDTQAAQAMANEYGADILVLGEAFSEFAGNFSGLISCRARVEARVVRADTGVVLAAYDTQESGVDITEGVAAKKALAKAGASMAEYLLTAIPKKLVPAELVVEVSATGLTFVEADKLRRMLAGTHMVNSVELREYGGGVARFDVRTALKAVQLAGEIASWTESGFEVTGVSSAKVELRKSN